MVAVLPRNTFPLMARPLLAEESNESFPGPDIPTLPTVVPGPFKAISVVPFNVKIAQCEGPADPRVSLIKSALAAETEKNPTANNAETFSKYRLIALTLWK